MSKTIHFYHGCPWAAGHIQMADTVQHYMWEEVTCRKCLSGRMPNGESDYWHKSDKQNYLRGREFLL
jgi:hypothetical protein